MRLTALIVVVWLVVGCRGAPVAARKGIWADNMSPNKMVIQFGPGNKFTMVIGNDQAAGVLKGTFTESADSLTLSAPDLGASPQYKIRYRDSGTLVLSAPGDETSIIRLKLQPGAAAFPEPDYAKARESQMNVSCLSNLKQVGLATIMYSQDFDSNLPFAAGWNASLNPYTRSEQVFSCPALVKDGKAGGYAMDSRLSGQKVTSFSDPRITVTFFESVTESVGASDPQSSLLRQPRHDGRVNGAYLDGHAMTMR